MNFYLSAVDEQLRHPDDKPSIGIILCKGRNEVIVEYALRDTNKPMGVAHYQLTPGLSPPEALQEELPTVAELSKEFPLLSVVKVRIEIERALNDLAKEHGLSVGPRGVGLILRELHRKGLLPDSATELLRVMNAMNQAAHGVNVDAAQAQEAIQVGNRFLTELRERGHE
jgi:YhcG PDDEXK nuclease domain